MAGSSLIENFRGLAGVFAHLGSWPISVILVLGVMHEKKTEFM